nr:uncharacterized protein LOC129157142 [Nothobranchius furzeri]
MSQQFQSEQKPIVVAGYEACCGNSDHMETELPGSFVEETDVLILTSPDIQELFRESHEEMLTTVCPVAVAEDEADLNKDCQTKEAVLAIRTASTQDPNPNNVYIIPMIACDKVQEETSSPVQRTSRGELKWKIKFERGCYYMGQSKPLDCYQFMNMLSVKNGWFDPEIKVSYGTAPLLEMRSNPLVFSESFPRGLLGKLPSGEHQVTDLSLFYLGEEVPGERKKFRGYITTSKGTLCMPISDDGIMMRRRIDVEATVQALRFQPDPDKMDTKFLKAYVFTLKHYGPLPRFNSQRGCRMLPKIRATDRSGKGRGHNGRGHMESKDKRSPAEPADASEIEAGEDRKGAN